MEGVIQSSGGLSGPHGPKPTNQQTSDTGGEGKQHGGGGGGDGRDEGRMPRLCFHSGVGRSRCLFFFFGVEVPVFCHSEE